MVVFRSWRGFEGVIGKQFLFFYESYLTCDYSNTFVRLGGHVRGQVLAEVL